MLYAETIWMDSLGRRAGMGNYVVSASGALAVSGAIDAASELVAESACRSTMVPAVPLREICGSGPYSTARDCAVLYFRMESGGVLTVRIPGPASSVFLADGKTVDGDAAIVASVIAEVVAYVVDSGGGPCVGFRDGTRSRLVGRKI